MLYNGGDCSQSDNRQILKFTCADFDGGPSAEEGSEAYIVVTDIKGNGITYFEGFVRVGENFRLNDNNERFQADMFIFIYNSSDTTEANLKQRVQYHSSCSSNLELKNRFGASQLVEFFNELQGNVTCFAAAEFDFEVQIPIDVAAGTTSVRLETLTALTSFAGFQDLTPQIAGEVVEAGGSINVSVNATLDLTVYKRYTILSTLVGTGLPNNIACRGTDFNTFFAGSQKPEGVPTAMPTRAPTISPAPTFDPLTTACSIESEIFCFTLRNGRPFRDCRRIEDPRDVVCSNGASPTSLTFLYRGTKCPATQDGFQCRDRVDTALPEQVFVNIIGEETESNFVVSLNELFTAQAVFDTADITISTVVNNGPGQELQTIRMNNNCDDGTLTLSKSVGALELAGFENEAGEFTSVYEVQMTYVVANGPTSAVINSAVINSEFQANSPFESIESPQTVERGARLLVFQDTTIVDAAEKFENGITFNFDLTAGGEGLQSGLPCDTSAAYSF